VNEAQAFEQMQERKRAYQLAFTSPAGIAVLEDLTRFCRGEVTCFDSDPRMHALLEGRRDVYLRIKRHLNLSTEQLLEIYAELRVETEGD
jgi:hypothetical protein